MINATRNWYLDTNVESVINGQTSIIQNNFNDDYIVRLDNNFLRCIPLSLLEVTGNCNWPNTSMAGNSSIIGDVDDFYAYTQGQLPIFRYGYTLNGYNLLRTCYGENDNNISQYSLLNTNGVCVKWGDPYDSTDKFSMSCWFCITDYKYYYGSTISS